MSSVHGTHQMKIKRRSIKPLLNIGLSISLLASTFLFTLAPNSAFAQTDDEILVVGERTGPRLWRVQKGDSELFILATVDYVPEDFEWNDKVIGYILEEADEVLLPGQGELGGANTPRLMGAMLRTFVFNRGRIFMKKSETLADKIGTDLAEQFTAARTRVDARSDLVKEKRKARKNDDAQDVDGYIENAALDEADQSALEKRLADFEPGRAHPYIQAQTLSSDAAQSAGIEAFSGAIIDQVKRLAKDNKVKARPLFEVDFAFRDFKLFLKSMQNFSRETNQACIKEAITFSNEKLPDAFTAANAWARGDVETLKSNISPVALTECLSAVSDELGGLKTFGGAQFDEFDATGAWMEAITPLMEKPGVRLALVSYDSLLREGGIKDRLTEAGYEVEGP